MARSRVREVARASRETTAPPEAVWDRWVDPSTWSDWVAGCQEAEVSAPLRCNRAGRRRRRNGAREDFVVTAFVPGRTYAETTRVLGARIQSRRDVMARGDGSEVSLVVTVRGMFAGLYRRRLADRLATSAPAELARLAQLAERQARVGARAVPSSSA